MKYSKEEKKQLVDSYNSWWHSIDFGDGIVSPGSKETNIPGGMAGELKLWKLDDPEIFKDKTVLDIGAWDGYYSFHAERSGAASVTALDEYVWLRNEKGKPCKKGFDISKKIFNSNVKEVIQSVTEISPDVIGTYDLVICAGVLYHLHNPMLALSAIKNILNPGGMLFLETTCTRITSQQPIMEYHPSNSLNNDFSNFWSMNPDCLKNILIDLGFNVDEVWTTLGNSRIACKSSVS